MNLLHVLLLAIVQGLCELLPVSSSAHVLVTAKLLGLDPTSPAMTFLLAMLHTGTMFAVIVYFWNGWRRDYFASAAAFRTTAVQVILATLATAVIGYGLIAVIEKVALRGHAGSKAEIEQLFGNLRLMAGALAAVGLLILAAGLSRRVMASGSPASDRPLNHVQAVLIGAVQGLCLPFRGFSRSGATISAGMLAGVPRLTAERFSFALAVVLTPPVIVRYTLRLLKAQHESGQTVPLGTLFLPGLVGMVFSFGAGLLALRFLSGMLERGRWQWFGVYCLGAAAVVFWLSWRL